MPDLSVRSFAVSSCGVSSPVIKSNAFSKDDDLVVQEGKSSPVSDTAPELQEDSSSIDESLRSFEINELYACYPESCESGTEEEKSTGLDPDSPQKAQITPEDRTKVPLPPAKTQNRQMSFSEEESSSDPEAENFHEGTESCLITQAARYINEATARCLNWDRLYNKGVSEIKICRKLIQRCSEAVERKKELDTQDARKKRLFAENQRLQCHIPCPLEEAYLKRTEEALRNIRGPYSGDEAFLWKAVGPPSKFYVPPPLQVSNTPSALDTHFFPARENECQNENGIQDTTAGNNKDAGAAEPNYQVR